MHTPDPQLDHTGFETEDRYSDESLAQERGSIPIYALPLAFFFAPGRFMRSYGVHIGLIPFGLILWITGASLVVQRVEAGVVLNNPWAWFPKTWMSLVWFMIIGGFVRGVVLYWVGGAWFKVRLLMCSVQWSERWSKTNRIYFSAGIAKHVFYFGVIVYSATKFESFILYMQEMDEQIALAIVAIYLCLNMFSSITLYRGVVSIFPAKRIWAAVWFLVLPILLNLLATALVFMLPWISGFATKPMLDSPSVFQSESFAFEYPNNWYIEQDMVKPGPQMWVQIFPIIGDGMIEIEIYNMSSSEDIIEIVRSGYEEESGVEFIGKSKPITRLGMRDGSGRQYRTKFKNKDFTVTLFELPLDEWTSRVIKVLVETESAETLQPGFDHIIRTLRITNHDQLAPNIARTYTARQEPIEFEIPINWWYTPEIEPAFTGDDGTAHAESFSLNIETPGYGYFRVYVYESDRSPRTELGITIDSYTDAGQLIDEQPLESWLGLTGYGAVGDVQGGNGKLWELSIIVTRLTDGRILEIRRGIFEPSRELQHQGFELIESTFKLLVEPESP